MSEILLENYIRSQVLTIEDDILAEGFRSFFNRIKKQIYYDKETVEACVKYNERHKNNKTKKVQRYIKFNNKAIQIEDDKRFRFKIGSLLLASLMSAYLNYKNLDANDSNIKEAKDEVSAFLEGNNSQVNHDQKWEAYQEETRNKFQQMYNQYAIKDVDSRNEIINQVDSGTFIQDAREEIELAQELLDKATSEEFYSDLYAGNQDIDTAEFIQGRENPDFGINKVEDDFTIEVRSSIKKIKELIRKNKEEQEINSESFDTHTRRDLEYMLEDLKRLEAVLAVYSTENFASKINSGKSDYETIRQQRDDILGLYSGLGADDITEYENLINSQISNN